MIRLFCLLTLAALSAAQPPGPRRSVSPAEVARVHSGAIVFDTHNDYPMLTVDGVDFRTRRNQGHTDLPRMRQGGMSAQIFAAYVAPTYVQGNRSAHRALEMIDSIKRDIVGQAPADTFFATTVAEVAAAKRQGKMAILVGIEGGHAIQDSLRLLRTFYDQGVRYLTLTHTNTNNWADSEGDQNRPGVKHHNGLTPFGKEVIREMNRLGMMVDVAHVADKTFWDVLAVSTAPIFSSHSSCRAVTNVTRNMTDEMIVAMAKKGGQININFSCDFLSQKAADSSPYRDPVLRPKLAEINATVADPAERRARIRALTAGRPVVRATLADVVAHINHAVKLAGIDHVGIGSDFDGITCAPIGLDDTSQWPNLTRALLEAGYSEQDVHKLLGGNMLRFMRAVEAAKTNAN